MKSSRVLVVALVAVGLLAVGLAAALGLVLMNDDPDDSGSRASDVQSETSEAPMSPLRPAWLACRDFDEDGTVELTDEDQSIVIDTGQYGSVVAADCILDNLEVSEAIRSQMDHTTAMMGVQTADQDGLAYQWSYHPDNGLSMTITVDGSE